MKTSSTCFAFCGLTVAALASQAIAFGDQNTYNYNTHPGFTVDTLSLPARYSVMSVDWLSNGDMVMTTCQSSGNYGGGGVPGPNTASGVYIVSGVATANPTVRQIASMFRQPSGAVVVNDTIYVSDRQAFFRINSLNPANIANNKTRVISYPVEAAPPDLSNNPHDTTGYWHQYVFCPRYYNGRFHAVYSGTIRGGGNSDNPASTSYSGAYLTWTKDSAQGFQKLAGGFRSPNGNNIGPGGMMMTSDHQGGWVPSCPLNIIRPNKFYGHRQNPAYTPNWAQAAFLAGTMEYEPPVAWMLDGSAPNGGGPGQGTSQPLYMDRGPYAGDWIVGDNNAKGLSRVVLDPVNGGVYPTANYNGSVTFFTNGLGGQGQEANPNRLSMHPSQPVIYVGTLGYLGNWPTSTAQPFYRIAFDNAAVANTFEILWVKSRANGIEIKFSKPVNPATAVPGSFVLNHYQITRQSGYGAGNTSISAPSISQVQVSNDGRRVFLQVGNVAAVDRVLKIIAGGVRAEGSTTEALWFNQAYFTHNYQSNLAFNPVSDVTGLRHAGDAFLDSRVSHLRIATGLQVNVNLQGAYTVSLSQFNGVRVEHKQGRNPGEIRFTAQGRKGLYVLQVAQGGRVYRRPVAF
jgi:hypothetical protein